MPFKALGLIEPLVRALVTEGYTIPTPIQLKAIPDLLKGKDLIGIAQTGTGKTAAFVLPILQRLKEVYPRKFRVLVLAPTRELAAQIGESFSAYGRFLRFKHTVIFGGVSQGAQVNAIYRGVDIVIATPGRLLDLMNQGKRSLRDIEFFVLDEADRMLDMGFIHDIKKIILRLPPRRQTLFFSATMSREITDLAGSILNDPVRIEVAAQGTTVEKVKQCVFFVDPCNKQQLLLDLLRQEHLKRVLVFMRTKHHADRLAKFLKLKGIHVEAIHGNKSQGARVQALHSFKSGKIRVLIATDIAARGIDIENISHVINYELPNEPESYVHRIGRTARAGAEGTAYSFCAADERDYLHSIEKLIRQRLEVMEHVFHSDIAKNATGAAARPPPKHQQQNRGRFGSHTSNQHRSSSHGPSHHGFGQQRPRQPGSGYQGTNPHGPSHQGSSHSGPSHHGPSHHGPSSQRPYHGSSNSGFKRKPQFRR